MTKIPIPGKCEYCLSKDVDMKVRVRRQEFILHGHGERDYRARQLAQRNTDIQNLLRNKDEYSRAELLALLGSLKDLTREH
jgi:hypothetical protein